jgi:hypothetical protein
LFLARLRNSFGLAETSLHGNLRLVLARPRSSFGLAESSLFNDYFCTNASTRLCCPFGPTETCLGPLKELIASRERPCNQPLRANRDVFASQHMNSQDSPKDMIEATSKIHLSLAN